MHGCRCGTCFLVLGIYPAPSVWVSTICLGPKPQLQGVPLRLELGPRDMEGGVAMLARRDNGGKQSCAWGELAAAVPQLLEQIQVG